MGGSGGGVESSVSALLLLSVSPLVLGMVLVPGVGEFPESSQVHQRLCGDRPSCEFHLDPTRPSSISRRNHLHALPTNIAKECSCSGNLTAHDIEEGLTLRSAFAKQNPSVFHPRVRAATRSIAFSVHTEPHESGVCHWRTGAIVLFWWC